MKKKVLSIIVLLITINSYGQLEEETRLPEGGVDEIDLNQKHYTIHYTQDQKLFFNNTKLRFWDQIASSILEETRQPKMNAVSNIIIYADKELSYAFIERIRHEIGKVWSGYIHLKSDDYETSKGLSFYINGSAMATKEYKDTDWVYGPKIIYTSKEFTGDEPMPNLEDLVWPIGAVWQHNFSGDFFAKYVAGINEFLNRAKYKALTIQSDSTYSLKKNLMNLRIKN